MPGLYNHFPDHSTGFVKYTGSSTDPEYTRFIPSGLRANRSTRRFCVLLGNDVERPMGCSLKLVVSTTSVVPSQRPVECPCRKVCVAGGCLRPSRYTMRSVSSQSTFITTRSRSTEIVLATG